MSNRINIHDEIVDNNLVFYMFLKSITKIKFTESQFDNFSRELKEITMNKDTIYQQIEYIMKNKDIVGNSAKRNNEIDHLLGVIYESNDHEKMYYLLEGAVYIYSYKDLIISESKAKSANLYTVEDEEPDFLSLKYDINSIKNPYSLRVVTSLFISALINDNTFISNDSVEIIHNIKNKVDTLENNYYINSETMFSIIMQESVNQSIISDAGNNYESRIQRTLVKEGFEVTPNSHDDRLTSVEYDFKFKVNKYTIGISAKRTLRERYKQNHRSVSELGVDKMLIITLGTDLNEAKIDNILTLQGQYILVSAEIYNSKDYMKQNERVFSSDNLGELFDVLGRRGY